MLPRHPVRALPPLLLCWALLLAAPALAAADRVALLIGNSAYTAPGMKLRNPVNDAVALGAALRDLGFVVDEATDEDTAGMVAAVERFGRAAEGAEMALFFYAGHGVQIGGRNHLIGTEFAGNDIPALQAASITMDQVQEVLVRAGPKLGMLILDACRNNPFSDAGVVEKGLVRSSGGAGLLIAYATDPGNVAYDGAGENSVFTASLLENIAAPGLDVRLMLGRVRQQVVLDTEGRQVPWVEESVLSDYAFAPALPGEEPADGMAAELARWRGIASDTDPAGFRAYLRDYPDGFFASFARERLDVLAAAAQGDPLPAETLLASADPDRMSAALAALGLVDAGETRDLQAALNGYRRQLPDPDAMSEARLYTDAARVSMFLAATTLQRLKTDLVALRSVERTLGIAEDALAQIEEIARTNPDARPVLRQAHQDVVEIENSRGVILRRLDQSRSYYDEVLTRAVTFFPDDASVALVGGSQKSRNLGLAGAQLTQNAALFLRHVRQSDDSRKGSYRWMADLIPPE